MRKDAMPWNGSVSAPKVFDSHFHIIDRRFPLVANNGYLPDDFTCEQYLDRTKSLDLVGGAVVSGSFQAYDQTYLVDALQLLGPSYVGVTELPATVNDEEVLRLDGLGVRAIRFNIRRGGSENIQHLETVARRVFDLARWHVELYVDSKDLADLYERLVKLPSASIDHLGLSKEGFPFLLKLAEKGVRVKATGFGRVEFDVRSALKEIYAANPKALMFGTDLPSTRAPRPYSDDDLLLVMESLGEQGTENVLYGNALEFYRLKL